MILHDSHPDRWAYAGILKTETWPGEARVMRRWDGESVLVRRGEPIRILRTGAPEITFVDVVRA